MKRLFYCFKNDALSAKGLSLHLPLRENAQSAQEAQASEGLISKSKEGELMYFVMMLDLFDKNTLQLT